MTYKKLVILFCLVLSLLINPFINITKSSAQQVKPFSDVPPNHFAYEQIHRLRELGITQGIGNNMYGVGRIITRGEFITYLVRLMGWDIIKPDKGSFKDNMNPAHNFYGTIETALAHGVIKKDSDYFRTDDPITREEMAIMIVRALGYDTLAGQLDILEKPFDDVSRNYGYITIVKDLGITAGTGPNTFSPNGIATREQAAAMMIRMYDKLNTPMQELHAFYAISSSSQIDKFSQLDSVSFGWAQLEYDENTRQVFINTDGGDNSYYIPQGYEEVLKKAADNNVSRQLMFFVKDQNIIDPDTGKTVKLAEYIVTRPEIRKPVINAMVSMVNETKKYGYSFSFDGMVSDFEGLKGDTLKQAYNEFLTELKAELSKTGKKLYVAVHPRGKPGQVYFDGYDYRTIGEIADKVILMAHDYDAVSLSEEEMLRGYTDTPVTPIDEVYCALKSITDPVSGVRDINKIWLQLSMDTVQWKLKDGKVIRSVPYHPLYSQLIQRFLTGVQLNYSEYSQNPYAKFYNSEDGTDNVIWYENQRSIAAKIKLAKLFGIKGLSIWRLGNIPEHKDTPDMRLELDIWGEIISNF
ncbi:MAG: hypothetical protein GX022_08160 [Clostridiaceae bacterium]|nr:hypothetical protein [Clostridiaceae bacterium]